MSDALQRSWPGYRSTKRIPWLLLLVRASETNHIHAFPSWNLPQSNSAFSLCLTTCGSDETSSTTMNADSESATLQSEETLRKSCEAQNDTQAASHGASEGVNELSITHAIPLLSLTND